jgi:Asp-tRNA(Asn)/Glu-tRNA(Gln) amidotransferase A subunit family amidase
MTDLHYLSAVDALRMFRTGELSPVELVSAVIARAEATEPVVNAFAETFYEQALAAAADAEARPRASTSG